MDHILHRTNSTDVHFQQLIKLLDADLRQRNGDLMDIYDQHNIIELIDTVVVAYVNDEAAGCGCFKKHDEHSVELKRMFVKPEFRGRHISSAIIRELESWARQLGYERIVLETGQKQQEAINLYTRTGYVRIPNYEPYIDFGDSICFSKTL